MVCGDKSRLWVKKALLCIGLIILAGGLPIGCGDLAEVDVIEYEKDLNDDYAKTLIQSSDDTEEVLISYTDGTTHVQVYFQDITIAFNYPSLLATGISAATIPAIDEDSFFDFPERKMNIFDNYLIEGRESAYISIISIEDYYNLYGSVAEKDINKLKTFIINKAVPVSNTVEQHITSVPHYLPSRNAGQLFAANVKFIESKTISGFRYLTYFFQSYDPITEFTYTYQGMTSDQKYYIAAAFPANYPALTRHNEDYLKSKGIDWIDHGDWWGINNCGSWREVQEDYLNVTVQMLDEAAAEDFEPSLLILDEIIKSFQVE